MTLQEIASQFSINYEEAVLRFGGSETLYCRFLNKFLQDNTYEMLVKAVIAENYDLIEQQAHTLKGVAANLGLQKLSEASNCLVQAVRAETTLTPFFAVVQKEYQRITSALLQLDSYE